MKRKGFLLFIFMFFILSNLIFAQSNFFGIEVYDYGLGFDALYNVHRNDEGGVSYNYNDDYGNTSIYCFGEANSNFIRLTITNNSKVPIDFNYYMDTFEIVTNDGTLYQMGKPDILNYPSDILNPNKSITINLSNPVGNISDIFIIGATINYGNTLIFIRKIEE